MPAKVLLTPAELQAMLQDPKTIVIDSRAPAAYAAGHIPGAVNVHEIFTYLATSTPEGMAELRLKFAAAFGAAGLGGDETAVIYEGSMNSGFGQSCRGYLLLTRSLPRPTPPAWGRTPSVMLCCFTGARASNRLVALNEAGMNDVKMYFGSWNEWSRDPALPIESGVPFAAPAPLGYCGQQSPP